MISYARQQLRDLVKWWWLCAQYPDEIWLRETLQKTISLN